MSSSDTVIVIPTRLEESGRFFILSQDEIPVVVVPVVLGLVTQNMFPGLIIAVLAYLGWSRLKGEGGFYALHAIRYWYFPKALSYLPSLPDSAVSRWNA